jgi:Domain of unknown function (DUF3883)
MAEETKSGTNWQDDELDLIVADYFAMLAADLSGQAYVKSRHSAALMAKVGRSHRSVEFKHQNISAVLDELGMPWIPGYKPKLNYQNAIFDAIDRYLTKHTSVLEPASIPQSAPPLPVDVFVAPPVLRPTSERIPKRLRQLIAKFDPVERDYLNRSLGKAGEAFVVDLERNRLKEGNRADLARKVRWTAVEDGDGAGYDVTSFSLGGHPQFIEVKTTNGSSRTPFFLTRNEWDIARQYPEEWRIYRVHLFASGPRVFTVAPPLEINVKLSPETWRASF